LNFISINIHTYARILYVTIITNAVNTFYKECIILFIIEKFTCPNIPRSVFYVERKWRTCHDRDCHILANKFHLIPPRG